MRSFALAVGAVVILGVLFWLVLGSLQESVDVAFRTVSVRN
jgi:hypothetical protein